MESEILLYKPLILKGSQTTKDVQEGKKKSSANLVKKTVLQNV